MKILSHRGFWRTVEEKNSSAAFHRSFSGGFGTETDVRDCAGQLVISHDAPVGNEMLFEEFLDIYCSYDISLPLALNIKADGIGVRVAQRMRERGLARWFTFDMSVPDTVQQLGHDVPVFLRRSEYEAETLLFERGSGVWLDAFKSRWYTRDDIAGYLQRGKSVCMVSPELHRRDYRELWALLQDMPELQNPELMICTDLPVEARAYFQQDAE